MDFHLPIVVEEVQEHSRSISNEKVSELKKKLDALKKTFIRNSIAFKEHNSIGYQQCRAHLFHLRCAETC